MMTSSNRNISRVTGPLWGEFTEFPSQRPVTRSFDVFFDLRLNKRSSKQSKRQWVETPSRSLWRHCNECHPCLRGSCRNIMGEYCTVPHIPVFLIWPYFAVKWRCRRFDEIVGTGCTENLSTWLFPVHSAKENSSEMRPPFQCASIDYYIWSDIMTRSPAAFNYSIMPQFQRRFCQTDTVLLSLFKLPCKHTT